MLNDTQNGFGFALGVGEEGKVSRPIQVPGYEFRAAVVVFFGESFDLVGVLLANLADIGMADGFAIGERVAAVEDIFNFSQAGFGIDGE